MEKLVLTGTSIEESQAVLELCQNYNQDFPEMLYATAGIHPHDASSLNKSLLTALRELAAQPQVVASARWVWTLTATSQRRAEQEKAFEAQLELAAELQLPVFLHERDAADRQLQIINPYRDHLADAYYIALQALNRPYSAIWI